MTQASVQPQTPRKGNALAITGMILGIVSVVLCWLPIVSLPCGIGGLIFSILGIRRAKTTGTGRGVALAGLVLSILGLLAGLVFTAIWILAMRELNTWMDRSWQGIKGGDFPTTSPGEHLPALPLLRALLGSA